MRYLVLVLLLAGCTPQVDPNSFFGGIHEYRENGVRTVEVEIRHDAPGGRAVEALGTRCYMKDGTELPDWGIDIWDSVEEEDITLIDRVNYYLTNEMPNPPEVEVLRYRFTTPEAPPIEWPLEEHEEWEYGRFLMEQGYYNDVICRETAYFIDEGDGSLDDYMDGWDYSRWHELEYIEF